MDLGHGVTHTFPVYEGYVVFCTSLTWPLRGGFSLCAYRDDTEALFSRSQCHPHCARVAHSLFAVCWLPVTLPPTASLRRLVGTSQ